MSLLDLTVVKPHLKIDQSTDDAVLQAKLDSAEAYVSRTISGPDGTLAATEVIEVDYWTDAIVLQRGPIVNVASVTGSLYGARALDGLLIQPSGVIRPQPLTLPLYADKYTVVYTAGYEAADDLSPELTEAVRLMTQHFYATQRGPTTRPGTGGNPGTSPDAYARAHQILDEFRGPGIA